MRLIEWQPPAYCLTVLTTLVTLVAALALVLTTLQLVNFLATHGAVHPGMAGLWLLYAAVAVTGVKSLLEWTTSD